MTPRHLILAFLAGGLAAMAIGDAKAEQPAGQSVQSPKPKCEIAEVNPVTGHVLCIKPLGAPVDEAPPAEASAPCSESARGDWSFGPKCKEAPPTQ